MRYIKNYSNFSQSRKADNLYYFYNIGKESNKSIFENCLISERIDVTQFKKNINFKKLDKIIIKEIYESFLNNDTSILEEENIFGKVWNATKNAWKGGINLVGKAYNNFKEFLKNIKDTISNIFKKISQVFIALWEITKTAGITLVKSVGGWIIKNQKGPSVEALSEIISDESFSTETGEVVSDLNGVKSRFSKGEMGNTSDEVKKKLEEEASEYDGVDDLDKIEDLVKDSFNLYSKFNFERVYYSLKGFLVEGGNLSDVDMILNEAQESQEYNVGDKVKYKSKTGEEIEKEITKIEGDKFYFKDKEGNEFYKDRGDIVSKSSSEESDEKKEVKGRMGVMGWVLECFKLIIRPIDYLVLKALKYGTNGALYLISGVARRGLDKAFKYKAFGKVLPKVDEIISGEAQDEGDSTQQAQESIEQAGEVSINKNQKLKSIFSGFSKVVAPIIGASLVAILETQIGPVLTILKYTLLVVSSIQLVRTCCERGLVKGKICSLANFQFG
jgi:hypothetical protein